MFLWDGCVFTPDHGNNHDAILFVEPATEEPRRMLELRIIDDSRVGKTMPDSSAAVDIDGDGHVEVLSSMQDSDGHPEVLLYKRTGEGGWEPTVIGVVKEHKEEVEWLVVGKPFPGDSRYCVAVSVQHKKDGLVVFRVIDSGKKFIFWMDATIIE